MAYMHQIRFRLGSAPDPAEGAYSAPQTTLAGLKFGSKLYMWSLNLVLSEI